MGKVTGFLEYERKEDAWRDPKERLQDFEEMHKPLEESARRQQAARCMNCGVPFCQSAMKLSGMVVGCPLHNLIPEWNDALYQGQEEHAIKRLLKTNPFPEFTGRVCPALCEKACINGQDGAPVTVRDNERYLIEGAYENGLMTPVIPARRSGKKVAVIGSGPAGLAAAQALNQRGHLVTVYEREDEIGGLLMYGIPNMKLDKNVIRRRRKRMEEEGITFVTGADIGNDPKTKKLLSGFDATVLCCGAKNARSLPAADPKEIKGVYFAVDFLSRVTKGVVSGQIPEDLKKQVAGKDVVVVGGGDTGNDCIGTVLRLGAKSVTALEMMPQPPVERTASNPWPEWPKTLRTDYGHEEAIALFGEDPRVFETTVKEVHKDKNKKIKEIVTVKVKFENGKLMEQEGSEKTLSCQLLLIAAGFIGAEEYLPKSLGLALTQRHTIQTQDPEGYTTDQPSVFAAGDARRGQSLVVWAIHEGLSCAQEVDAYLMGYRNK